MLLCMYIAMMMASGGHAEVEPRSAVPCRTRKRDTPDRDNRIVFSFLFFHQQSTKRKMSQQSKPLQARAHLYTRKTLESLSPEDRIRGFLKASFSADERFDSRFHDKSDIRLVSIEQTSPHRTVVTFAFTVDHFYCNGSGNLHGTYHHASLLYTHAATDLKQEAPRPPSSTSTPAWQCRLYPGSRPG